MRVLLVDPLLSNANLRRLARASLLKKKRVTVQHVAHGSMSLTKG